MFVINDDQSIYVTRGDDVMFSVSATNNAGVHVFKNGDVIRFKVFEKKACENVVLQKDTLVEADIESVQIMLSRHDTKIGETISKPTDYWYEVELNPYTNPQTIVGYDDDGAKVFRLYPEGADISSIEDEDDIPLVDDELDATSDRPIQNQAITRALVQTVEMLREEYANADEEQKKDLEDLISAMQGGDGLLNYVKNTDYATKTVGGVVKVGDEETGIIMNANNTLVVAGAGVSDIQDMASTNRPITPYYLKQAVRTGLVMGDEDWTDEEKTKSRKVIGALGAEDIEDKVGRADVVDNLLSDATDLPVSANQVKILKSIVDNIESKYTRATSVSFQNSTLADLVNTLNVMPMQTVIGKFKLPASFSPSGTDSWYIGWFVFQNKVGTGADVSGKCLLERNSELYLGRINGTSDDTYSVSWAWLPITNMGTKSLEASRALAIDSNGKVAVSNTTSLELSYLSGVTSKVQTQLNNRVSRSGGSGSAMTGALHMNGKEVYRTNTVSFGNASNRYGHISEAANQNMYIASSQESAYELFLGVIDSGWSLCPATSGNLQLGTGNHKWGQIYSSASSISTSDRNVKKDIEALTERHLKFFRMLQPVSFAFVDGTSGRTHIGFIAQDVEDAMKACGLSDLDFAGFCKDQMMERIKHVEQVEVEEINEDGETEVILEDRVTYEDVPIEGKFVYSLRYDEFIGLVTQATQEALNRIDAIEKRLDDLENKQ